MLLLCNKNGSLECAKVVVFHIENTIGKANRSLGFIRRNLYSCPENVKSQANLTLVRPCLEYALSVWDPHTQKHCHDIEGVQRRAARFVKNRYEREPGTVTSLLNDLHWPSLELRRKIAQLTTVYKRVNNKIRVNILEYIARPTRVIRSYHSSKFINIGCSSNTYKYNFFTWTLKEWNSLPPFLLDQTSVEAFKSALTNYFNLSHWFYTSFHFIIYLLLLLFIYLFVFLFCTLTVIYNIYCNIYINKSQVLVRDFLSAIYRQTECRGSWREGGRVGYQIPLPSLTLVQISVSKSEIPFPIPRPWVSSGDLQKNFLSCDRFAKEQRSYLFHCAVDSPIRYCCLVAACKERD